MNVRTTKCTSAFLYREKFLQEVNSLIQKPSHPLAKTKTLVKSLMNRAELLLHVTIAAQSGLTRSISGTPAETPGTKPAPCRHSVLFHLVDFSHRFWDLILKAKNRLCVDFRWCFVSQLSIRATSPPASFSFSWEPSDICFYNLMPLTFSLRLIIFLVARLIR